MGSDLETSPPYVPLCVPDITARFGAWKVNSANFAITEFSEVRWHERERSCAAFARQGGNHIPELDSPDLLHQVQSVVVGPLLLDFAPGDPINEDAPYARRI